MKFHYFDDISFFPYKNEFKGYSFKKLHKDLMAGISVSLLTLPQAMAYALVAGLPLSTGLFAAIFSCMIAAFFGSSKHLVVGPSNAIAILIQYGTAEILYAHFRELTGAERDMIAFQVMTQLAGLVAVIHLLAASFKLGRLTQFISYSVVLGYVMGAAAAIVINQLFVFFGIPPMEGVNSLFAKAFYFIFYLHQTHWQTLTVGLGSLLLLVSLKRMGRGIPYALITYIATTAILSLCSYLMIGGVDQVATIGDTGDIGELTPKLMLPYFDFKIMNKLLPIAFAVALLSILETSAVAKTIASNSGQRISINQEILGLGMGNLTSAVCGAMPISGSTSRTTLNFESGAQTRLAAMFGAGMVGFILYVFGDYVVKIPLAALSALLLMTAGNLIKKRQLLLCLKATSSDAFVFLTTFLSCLVFSIDVAFFIGVSLSITLYLKKAAVPQVQQYLVDDNGRIKSLEFCSKDEMTAIRFIKVKGELFFGAADLFQAALKSIAEDESSTKVIILQLKNARDIDATSCMALQQLHDYLLSSGRYLILSGLTLHVWEVMSGSGLVKLIGKENLFVINDANPNAYFNKAVQRAKTLAKVEEQQEVRVSEEVPGTAVILPDPI
ncbi:putative high affinity sulfate transporter,sulfate permease family [Waddlia chondrophila 2032/99]|uniref:Putative high affinity sulfate transporter, sulfate permease family n=2 Tax=Waddlia chondrophila TaxID=71667 RepID=D6YSC5_WADCW|nr:SulP family inorganic anion transporter [Waddlia chondrophila]ADI38970.1 putative high affinity sulfate transporter, sulfate permease family [Waddlia chondrophila WSU 86-1044]CCB92091.1 putative high affinity sulfate transporter,sulfate permease family [Waddlia chondrophila 2032/99]